MATVGGRVLSVNVGTVREFELNGRHVESAIWKSPVVGRVAVRGVNLEGDDQADRKAHGGPDKAVYAYAVEDVRWWERAVGRSMQHGQLGENLTTEGIDVNEALVGERWEGRDQRPRGLGASRALLAARRPDGRQEFRPALHGSVAPRGVPANPRRGPRRRGGRDTGGRTSGPRSQHPRRVSHLLAGSGGSGAAAQRSRDVRKLEGMGGQLPSESQERCPTRRGTRMLLAGIVSTPYPGRPLGRANRAAPTCTGVRGPSEGQ